MDEDISTWTEASLQRLITEQEKESLNLDYKRSEALGKTESQKNELAKDVSALANSAGGILIYGIAEEGYLPTNLDMGVDPGIVSRESLEDTIHSRIHPRIDGLVIKAVELSASRPNVAYVVSVPQSLRAPHMAADRRYYKRFNFKSEPMEDYEVRDMMRRQEGPALKLAMSLTGGWVQLPRPSVENPYEPVELPITIQIANDNPTPAHIVLIRIWIDEGLEVIVPQGFRRDPELAHFNAAHPREGFARFGAPLLACEWISPPHMPVWLGVPQFLTLTIRLARARRYYGIHWRVDSPRMEPVQGDYTLHSSIGVVSLAAPNEKIFTE